MTPEPTAWTRLRARVDPAVRRSTGGTLYTAYPLTQAEHVSTEWLPLGVYDLRDYLTGKGYTPQRLSAAKRHPDTGRLHVLSMRRRPDTLPDAVEGTALEGVDPKRLQFHLHAFPTTDGRLDVFAHLEYAPDLRPLAGESVGDMVARLRTHYAPTYDRSRNERETWTYLRGVADPALSLG